MFIEYSLQLLLYLILTTLTSCIIVIDIERLNLKIIRLDTASPTKSLFLYKTE